MRKRSKYRPKKVLVNPVGYVLEGMTPVGKHDSFLLDLKIKNHLSMSSLTQGKATREDMDKLISMSNITEALYRLGFGTDYKDVLRDGSTALLDIARRGAETNRFVLWGVEMKALNTLMELHDAQMEVITIKDMERAVALVENERRQKRMTSIIERK
jgi:hypothetical protein